MFKKISLVIVAIACLSTGYLIGMRDAMYPQFAWAQSDIDNAQAIRFCNEQIRPLCERVRALKIEIDSAITDWYLIQSYFPNDSSPVQDGREAEGVSRLTGEDINTVMYNLTVIQNALNEGGVSAAIAKPCVRPLQVIGD